MAKTKVATNYWGELLAFGLYKRNQGRLSRQLTALALLLIVGFGAYTLSQGVLSDYERPVRVGLPLAIALIGAWVVYRLVNYPPFADFLIDVEGEMTKVSWASRQELYRSTVVVIVTMVFLSAVLFGYDFFWQKVLKAIGILQF